MTKSPNITNRRFRREQDLSDGKVAINMHCHSKYSFDATSPVSTMLARAKRLGIGLAITDHNDIRGSLEARHQSDVMIIPGVEVTVGPGIHVLCYFNTHDELKRFHDTVIKPFRGPNPFILEVTVESCVYKAAELNATIVFPHPYKTGQGGIIRYLTEPDDAEPLMEQVHAIEGLNAMVDRRKNSKARAWAAKEHKPMTAGSDGHSAHQLDRSVTISKAGDPKEFLHRVRAGKIQLVGKEYTFPYVPYLRISKELRMIIRRGGIRILRDQIKHNVFKR